MNPCIRQCKPGFWYLTKLQCGKVSLAYNNVFEIILLNKRQKAFDDQSLLDNNGTRGK